MPTEMLGPGTEAALELLVETTGKMGDLDPLEEGEWGDGGNLGEVFFSKNSWLTSWWFGGFSQNRNLEKNDDCSQIGANFPQGFRVKMTHNLKPPPSYLVD